MIPDNEKAELKLILNTLTDENLLHLLSTSAKEKIKIDSINSAKDKEVAIYAIITYTRTSRKLLKRMKVTREALENYCNLRSVTVLENDSSKDTLVESIIKYWVETHKKLIAPSTQELHVNSSTSWKNQSASHSLTAPIGSVQQDFQSDVRSRMEPIIQQIEQEKLKYESDWAELTKKKVDLEDKLENVKEENGQLENEKLKYESDCAELTKRICKLKKELAGANAARLNEKKVHENEKLEYEWDCAELTKKNVDLEHELKDVKEEKDQHESDKVDLKDQLENVKEKNGQLENEKVDLEDELENVKEENRQLENEKNKLNNELTDVKSEKRERENEMQTLRRNFNVQIEFLKSELKALKQPAVADQDKNIHKVQEVTTHKNVVADSRNGKVRKAQLDENRKKAPQVKQAYLKEKQIPMQVEIDKVAQRERLTTKRKCNDSAVPSRNREFSAYQGQPDTMVKKIKRVETVA